MSLDPSASPWPGVFWAAAVCLWIAAIGAPIAYAAFRNRPRLVWPFYAPIIGVVVVLLVTNLVAYVIPGAPAAWFGLIGPSVASAAIVWRVGVPGRVSRQSAIALLAMFAMAVGVFALAYANRAHSALADDTWQYPLAFRLARGVFPPVTPYGVDAGIGYHYGHNLLAASIMNTAGVLPWTAFDALTSFLVAVLVLAVAGFTYDVGAPLPLAVGLGVTVRFLDGGLFFGYRTGYLEGLAVLKPPTSFHHAIDWLDRPQWALAVSFVVLVAATLQASVMRRSAAVLAAGAAVFALAEAAVMIFASAALALVGVVRVVRLRGRERFVLAGALVVSALLVVLAGGPTSDALFGRGGTAGLARVAWEPVTEDLLPFQQAGPALVVVGIVPLTMVGAIAAYRRRSWGLGFLAAAGSFGLLAAELLQSPIPANDIRIFRLAQVVAIIGALSGVGALVGALRGARQLLATVAVVLLVFLPTSLPRATSNVHLALADLAVDDPSANNSGRHYRNRTTFGAELEANWEIYAWLARSLPTEARLLTLNARVSASAAGIASPRSGRDLQVFQHGYPTWVYRDALRFLHQDDLADMGISHLHVTDPLAAALAPSARRLLDDPDHFRLLVDMRTVSGIRHRVFEVLPGAGTTEVAPSSYRFLRRIVPPNAPVSMLGTLTWTERRELHTAFADHDHIGSSYPLGHDRGTRILRIETLVDLPDGGVVVLAEPLNPTALGVSRDSAIWTGYGMRAYDLAAAWSPVWRIGRGLARLPEPLRPICESAADGLLDLRLLGEPGTTVVAGLTELTLTGLPQEIQLSVTDCGALTLGAHADVAPFAQLRPHHSVRPVDRDAPIAGLGFDGGVEDDRAIVNVWYRNPRGVPFVTGTELRLYEASPLGVSLPEDNSNPRTSSLRWWRGPVALLHAPEQNARIEFDARRLELNGERGGGSVSSLMPGRTYLLTLNIAGVDSRYGLVEIQHIVPLVRIVLSDTGVAYEVFSGIVTLEHHKPGTILSRTGYDGGLAEDPDLIPR